MDPGMDPAGAFPVLERELRAALAEDERRQREGEAKLRALRQGVPDYDQFRSGARGPSAARGTRGAAASGDPEQPRGQSPLRFVPKLLKWPCVR